jgi:acetyl esterase/lipase
MHWFGVPRFALALLVVMAVAMPTTGGAQEATSAATPAADPQPPTQPTTGPGSSEALFRGVTAIRQGPPDAFMADSWLFVPVDPLPGTTDGDEPFPLVIFLHGSGATDADAYLTWIEHLVRRGAVVLYPLYEARGSRAEEYRQNVQDDVREGLATLEGEGVPVDLTRVAVVGHSLGAEEAVIYAASAAAAGLSVPTAVMSVALGDCPSSEGACLGVDLSTIPATTRILLVAEADDPDAAMDGVAHIWGELEAVPLENRDVVTLVTDEHGQPALVAVHVQALAKDDSIFYPLDAFDWYGTWKWLDALMSCAFDGEWCDYALGNTPEQRFMGVWSDGVPVTEAVVTDDPP